MKEEFLIPMGAAGRNPFENPARKDSRHPIMSGFLPRNPGDHQELPKKFAVTKGLIPKKTNPVKFPFPAPSVPSVYPTK